MTDEALSANLVLWAYELYAEFQERCEDSTTVENLPELKLAAAALCRMLDRENAI